MNSQPCLCGFATGSHTDDAVDPMTMLCRACLEAGCEEPVAGVPAPNCKSYTHEDANGDPSRGDE